ncbi:MAG: ABC transporter permease [Candidatus Eremiobacteraeota bacterium]|nr:ABC transporter permease [Candidatus Eremiobacteraeota bacterium]MBV8375256.1 ABC transporter permease [Candidatus Eremiobacteraeota bacterium]
MDWGKVKFFLGEVLRSFTRNAGMQVTAVGTVTITIVMLGLFLFVRGELGDVGNRLLDQIEISAYFVADATPAQVASARKALSHDRRVASVQFVSKKQGLAELRTQTRGAIDTALLTENPLPDKLRVRVHVPDDVPSVAVSLRRLPGIGNVVYGQTVVQRLLQLALVLHNLGIAVIITFLLVAGIIISNTIRLTVFARRREIAIMQLVGATNTYIRMPFICEGLLDGLIGASLAVGLLVVAHATLWPRLLQALPWFSLPASALNPAATVGELLLVGGAVGVIASWISVGRHLRT